MTTINFQCASCDGDYDIEIERLLDRPSSLKCPHCDARPRAHRAQQLAQALDDMLTVMAALRAKVRFELHLDSDALPEPYGEDADGGDVGLGRLDDDSDDSEDGDDEEEEDDALNELSFDDDDYDEDEDFDDDDEEEEEF